MSLLYIILAILGLGILVFIHELGHYWAARRVGMKVEAFAIGFGKPIWVKVRDGVRWQICMLPFGGYVKIAGMQKENGVDPAQIEGGFYSKTPWQRIQVALAGPVVNIVFSFAVFVVLWISGGRDKSFSEVSRKIGWIDPKSALFHEGVRPGDTIESYNGKDYTGFKDLIVASIKKDKSVIIDGQHIDYLTKTHKPFSYTLPTYSGQPLLGDDKGTTIGIVSSAKYLIYSGNEFSNGSPMMHSGIEKNDRILWVDGELVFSLQQLNQLTNDTSAFITVKRKDQIFHTKVPRVLLADLKLTMPDKGEIDDWQHAALLKGRIQDFQMIPYMVSPNLLVENKISFIDSQDEAIVLEKCRRYLSYIPLEEADQILAIDGKKISNASEMFLALQSRKIQMVVDRNPNLISKTSFIKADEELEAFSSQDLEKITSSIGSQNPILYSGSLNLLKPITPKPFKDFDLTAAQQELLAQDLLKSKQAIEAIKDPERRTAALLELERSQKRLVLGLALSDRVVEYNPNPVEQFNEVVNDTFRTLSSLFTGATNPKYVSGPVGIIQIVHYSFSLGIKEALFWMALISLNLGMMNLLPLPVLDGGHIVFSLIEKVMKRPINPKVMERIVVPFVLLLIGFFIFVTYHDIAKIIGKFF